MRFLIVDDEFWSRKCIMALLKEAGYPAEVIFEAEDGFTALEILSHQQIDIVFTDIRMPEMDGLAFIKRALLLNNNTSTEFALVTGYDDFFYAQTAISLGVGGFILKPIQKIEFLEVLNRLVAKLDESKAKNLRIVDSKNRQEQALFQLVLWKLITQQECSGEEEKRFLEYADSHVDGFCCYIFASRVAENMDGKELLDWWIDCLPLDCKGTLLQLQPSIYVGFAINKTGIKPQAFKEIVLSWKDRLEAGQDQNILTGISSSIKTMASLAPGCQMALYQLRKEIFFCGAALTAVYNGENATNDIEGRLTNAVLMKGKDEITQLFEAAVSLYTKKQPSIVALEQLLIQSGHCYNDLLLKYGASFHNKLAGGIKKDLLLYSSADHLVESLSHTFCALRDYIVNDRKSDGEQAVQVVKGYVFDNYNKKISLADMAGYVSLNRTYLSSLFKEQVGMSFVEYLTFVRMEYSCKMLKETSFSISKIAEEVGYENEQYFSKVFKKQTGITPHRYRKKNAVV